MCVPDLCGTKPNSIGLHLTMWTVTGLLVSLSHTPYQWIIACSKSIAKQKGSGSFFIMVRAVFNPCSFCAWKAAELFINSQLQCSTSQQDLKPRRVAFTLIRSRVSMWSRIPTSSICCKVMPSFTHGMRTNG